MGSHFKSKVSALNPGDSVHRLLVTGVDDELEAFHLDAQAANIIDKRGQTILYTVMENDLNTVLDVARKSGVTVQQRAAVAPFWPVVVEGKSKLKWESKQ